MRRSVLYLVALALLTACSDGENVPNTALGDLPCSGGAGGSLTLNERAGVAYSVSFAGDTTGKDSVHLQAIFVARGKAGWKNRAESTPLARPVRPGSTGSLSGADLGDLSMSYDRSTNTAWVHDQKVVLDTFNVVLVDRADSVGGPPVVAQRLRLKPVIALPPGICAKRGSGDGLVWQDSIRAILFRSPDVRAFIAP